MIPALVVVGLFGLTMLVGIVTSARRSTLDGLVPSAAWNAGTEREVWQDPIPTGETICQAAALCPGGDKAVEQPGCTYCGALPVVAANYRGERACASHVEWLPEEPKPWTPPANQCMGMREHRFPKYLPSVYVDGLSDLIGYETRIVRCGNEATGPDGLCDRCRSDGQPSEADSPSGGVQ